MWQWIANWAENWMMSPEVLMNLLTLLGGILLTAGLYSWYCYARQDEHGQSPFSVSGLLRLLAIPVLVSLILLFLTLYHRLGVLQAQQAVDSIIHMEQMFTLSLDVDDMVENLQLLSGDRLYLSILTALMPLMTVTFAVSLFRLPRFWFSCLMRRQVYVFSELSERTLMYAQTLQTGKVSKCLVVFCTDEGGKGDATLYSNRMALKRDICNLPFPPLLSLSNITFYLVLANDDEVTRRAVNLKAKYGNRGCRINCVLTGRLNEQLIDTANQKGRFKTGELSSELTFDMATGEAEPESAKAAGRIRGGYIEMLNEACRSVYQNLYDDPLFDEDFLRYIYKTAPADGDATVRILVLGAGVIGEELARTLLWYCQLPGLAVKVTVADQLNGDVVKAGIYRNNPMFEEMLRYIRYHNRASLDVMGEFNLLTGNLEAHLAATENSGIGFHKIFVATGDDLQNMQLAMRLRKFYLFREPEWGCPEIRVVVWDEGAQRVQAASSMMRPAEEVRQDQESCARRSRILAEHPELGQRCWEVCRQEDEQRKQNGEKAIPCDYHRYRIRKHTPLNRYNPACRIVRFGNIIRTISQQHSMNFDALCYNTFYSIPYDQSDRKQQLLEDIATGKVRIAAKLYDNYHSCSEQIERSNLALAIHGRLAYQWRKAVGKTQEEAPDALVYNEHIRWCILMLLEGNLPYPEDVDLDNPYLRRNRRDRDPNRGYHAALRYWERDQQIPEGTETLETIWKTSFDSNAELVRVAGIICQAREKQDGVAYDAETRVEEAPAKTA